MSYSCIEPDPPLHGPCFQRFSFWCSLQLYWGMCGICKISHRIHLCEYCCLSHSRKWCRLETWQYSSCPSGCFPTHSPTLFPVKLCASQCPIVNCSVARSDLSEATLTVFGICCFEGKEGSHRFSGRCPVQWQFPVLHVQIPFTLILSAGLHAGVTALVAGYIPGWGLSCSSSSNEQ